MTAFIANKFLAQPLDKILVAAGYQGIIRPEQGICRHTAALSMGEDVVPFAGR